MWYIPAVEYLGRWGEPEWDPSGSGRSRPRSCHGWGSANWSTPELTAIKKKRGEKVHLQIFNMTKINQQQQELRLPRESLSVHKRAWSDLNLQPTQKQLFYILRSAEECFHCDDTIVNSLPEQGRTGLNFWDGSRVLRPLLQLRARGLDSFYTRSPQCLQPEKGNILNVIIRP